MNKRDRIILSCGVLLTGIVIFEAVEIYNMKKSIDDINSSTSSNISGIYSAIGNIENGVLNTLNNELKKTNLTTDVNFTMNSVQENFYNLDVRADLRRAAGDCEVLFMYKNTPKNDWSTVSLTKNNELSYVGQVPLKYDGDYDYKVVTKGTISESGDIEKIDKYDFIPNPPSINYGKSYDDVESGFTTKYEVDKYILSIHLDDKEESKNKNMEIKCVDVIANVDNVETIYNFEYLDNPEHGDKRYEVKIPKEDLCRTPESSKKLNSLKVKITYDNGFIDFKDIKEDFNIQTKEF